MSRVPWILIASLAWYSCASSGTPAVQSPAAAAPSTIPAPPPVPADPLELLVANPEGVIVLQVEALRGSPVLARLRPYLERTTCISGADLDWILQASRRAVTATRTTPDGEQWLAILDGTFAPADATRLLTAAVERSGAPGTAATPEARGRFQLQVQSGLAASVLEGRVALLGSADWLRAAVDAIEQPSPNFAVSELWRELGPKVRCAERHACALSVANGAAAKRVEDAFAQLGSRDLAREFAGADTAAGLDAPNGVDLALAVRLSSADVAAAGAQQLKNWVWQAGLLTRIAGLPDVLSAARIRTEGPLLAADLSVNAGDLAKYEARAGKLFERAARNCQAVVASQ